MKTDIIRPNVTNFINSLRDMGYTFEIAVADILDNSISANATEIHIHAEEDSSILLSLLDNGSGMSETELVEAMRLGSKNPNAKRAENDLGRFGLGMKTASFSQCKKLTVITKCDDKMYSRQWDLDFIENSDEWNLITPSEEMLKGISQYNILKRMSSGTLIVWQEIDGLSKDTFTEKIYGLREHLSLVFHRFLEGEIKKKKLMISVNGKALIAFNPFNANNLATQTLQHEKLKIDSTIITVQPYILPHHSKLSRNEYEKYATSEGYTKSQGFYLYREGRLLIHGTWWGLNKVSDVHRLVRIRIDATNLQDDYWNIDIKKATAFPNNLIKNELKRILNSVLDKGTRPYTGRGKRLNNITSIPFWEIKLDEENIHFLINKEQPVLREIMNQLNEDTAILLNSYLKAVEAYLPLTAIQSHMLSEPHKINQSEIFTEEELLELSIKLRTLNLSEERIAELLKTEMFINRKGLLINDKTSS
ncbi:ATP-binding protein [Paenibacillus endoradicis]|uniref:ATP-binding protein n=1 Tax=Paenibacillus endoradicis TaxID=2972487 RepID=UPI002158DF58|nr:ATP-binding protein [Paenibacillus endoradicis]MCR8657808.1 ATP-binding protein [Paenibacillus endoradicis]